MGLNSYLLTIRMYGGAGAAATWGFEFRTSFSRGNVSFVLAVTFRARLFLFPVPCSLFPRLSAKSGFAGIPTTRPMGATTSGGIL